MTSRTYSRSQKRPTNVLILGSSHVARLSNYIIKKHHWNMQFDLEQMNVSYYGISGARIAHKKFHKIIYAFYSVVKKSDLK